MPNDARKSAKGQVQTPTQDMRRDIQEMEKKQARLAAELAKFGINSAQQQQDEDAKSRRSESGMVTTHKAQAMAAKATTKRMCAGADDSCKSHADTKPSGALPSGMQVINTKQPSAAVRHTKSQSSAIQGKPVYTQRGVMDKAPVKPSAVTIDNIPKRKQHDPIEVAVIQVMQEHSLTEVPREKSYRSMFNELVEIKAHKLVKSRIQRVKRRENRQKKH